MIRKLQGHPRIVQRHHQFMELLAGTNADVLVRQVFSHAARQIDNADRWNLRHKHFTAVHPRKAVEDELHAVVEGDPEPRHALVSDRQFLCAIGDQFAEERHHRTTGTGHVAVAHHGKPRFLLAGNIVGSDEQFVREQLGRAVQVDRAGGFVGGQRDNFFTPLSMAAAMMFSAPLTLVRMHSVGLYSAAGTCFNAAACTT